MLLSLNIIFFISILILQFTDGFDFKRTSTFDSSLLYGDKIVASEDGVRFFLLNNRAADAAEPGIYFYETINVQFTVDNNWQPVTETTSIQFSDLWTNKEGTTALAAAASGEVVRFSRPGFDFQSLLPTSAAMNRRKWQSIAASQDSDVILLAASASANESFLSAGIVISYDAGGSWGELTTTPQCNWTHIALNSKTDLIALASDCIDIEDAVFVLYRSTDGGSSWTEGLVLSLQSSSDETAISLVTSDHGVFIATNRRIFEYRTKNHDLKAIFQSYDITSLALYDDLIAISTSHGVYSTTIAVSTIFWLQIYSFLGGWNGIALSDAGYIATSLDGDVYFLLSPDFGSRRTPDLDDDNDRQSQDTSTLILLIVIPVAFFCCCGMIWNCRKRISRLYRYHASNVAVVSIDGLPYANATFFSTDDQDTERADIELAEVALTASADQSEELHDCVVADKNSFKVIQLFNNNAQ